MEYFQSTPRSPARIDLAFIRIGQQPDLILSEADLLAFAYFHQFPHILHHILVPLSLLGDACEVYYFLHLPAHYKLWYNFKMHCQCSKQANQLARQMEALRLMEQLLEKEREAHMLQLRAASQAIEDFGREKQAQLGQYEQSILKLGKKLDQYKAKNVNLSEKVKEQASTVKALLEKKLSLECEILKTKEALEHEREKRLEEARYISELKQVVALQDIQIKELCKQTQRQTEEITYLQREINSFGEIRGKFANIDDISQEQYQKEITLLKTSLEHQFSKNTNEIFVNMTRMEAKASTEIVEGRETLKLRREAEPFMVMNAQNEQLKKLANFAEYGRTYFELGNDELTLSQSKKVFRFISNIVKELQSTEQLLDQQRQANAQLSADLREKMEYFACQIRQLSSKEHMDKATQTGESGRLADLLSCNTNLKLKHYELVKIVSFLSRFALFLVNNTLRESTKNKYYHFAETVLYHPMRSHRRRLRPFCLSVLFIQMLMRKARKGKRVSVQQKLEKCHLEKYIHSPYLSGLLSTFALRERRKIEVKNHKIEELSQQKPQANPHQKIIQILNQESLNQGYIREDYSQVFTRFIFQTQQKRII